MFSRSLSLMQLRKMLMSFGTTEDSCLPTSPPTKFKLNLKHMIVYDSKDDGLMVGYEVILLSSSPAMRRRPAWIINYVNDKSSEERSVNRWLFHANCWRRHLRDVLHLWACPLSHHFISHLNAGRNYFVEILFVRLIWLLLSSRSFFFCCCGTF